MSDLLLALAIWLTTYLLHSTILFGIAWALERLRLLRSPALREQIWRAALIGALATASAQSLGIAERAPMASLFSLAAPSAATPTPSAPGGARGLFPSLASPRASALTTATPNASPAPESPDNRRAASWPRSVALLWLAGAALLALRIGGLGWRARRDLADRLPTAASARITRELEALCAAQRLRMPALSVTPALAGPVSLPNGEIVLPPWVLETLDSRQQRAVLAHELAHQARRDPQWLALALVLDTLLWLQPLQRLARRRLAALAELEADAWAARAVNDPRALAESLACCAERLFANRITLWSAGMVSERSPGSPLIERIDRLLKGTPMSQPKSFWPARAGAWIVLVAGVFLLPGCGPADLFAVSGRSSTSVSIDDDGIRATVRRPGYFLRMECAGTATFADDESDLAALSPGGEFALTEKVDGVTRMYRVKSDADGALARSFSRNGENLEIDAAARRWIADATPRMFRESGYDAEARVARLLARGGPERVLAEIDLAASDHAKSTYLGKLLGTVRLEAAQVDRALASVAKISSDYDLRRALELALETQELDAARVAQILTTAGRLGSDFELRSLLEKVAPRAADPVLASAFLAAARQLTSDFERRSALVALLTEARLDSSGLATTLDVAAELGSDFEKRTVLELLAGQVASDPELHRRYREVARDLGEFDRGQALRALDDATAL